MKDISNDSKRALALSKRDQVIESFKKIKERLVEVEKNGPQTREDIELLKMCVKFVLGEICFSESEQARLEEIGG